jgi:hypothetical protein
MLRSLFVVLRPRTWHFVICSFFSSIRNLGYHVGLSLFIINVGTRCLAHRLQLLAYDFQWCARRVLSRSLAVLADLPFARYLHMYIIIVELLSIEVPCKRQQRVAWAGLRALPLHPPVLPALVHHVGVPNPLGTRYWAWAGRRQCPRNSHSPSSPP